MRILHVIPTMSARYGGPAKACREMAMALAGRGHDVEIFTTNYDGFGGYVEPSVTSVAVGQQEMAIRTFPIDLPPDYFRISRPFAQALRQEVGRFDLVHIHSLYLFTTLAAGFYARRRNVPIIIRPHGSLGPYHYPRHRGRKRVVEALYQNRLLRHTAAIHYTSAEEQAQALPRSFGRPGFVVPLGLNIEDYRPLPPRGTFRERFPETRGKSMLLFLGRIDTKKGLDILAKAFGNVARQRDDIHLVIAGPDNRMFRPAVEGWLDAAGIRERTTFTGMLVGDDKLAALHDADLFVLPSYAENFGIAVIEAMACGLPVLISNRVNTWRDIKDGGGGEVEPLDPERFAERILDMLAERDRLKAYGERGIETVAKLFDWPTIGRRLERACEAVIAARLPEIA